MTQSEQESIVQRYLAQERCGGCKCNCTLAQPQCMRGWHKARMQKFQFGSALWRR